jgi:hypothetical protein
VQAWNRYAYVNNSPTNFHDPTGHNCEDLPDSSREACIKDRNLGEVEIIDDSSTVLAWLIEEIAWVILPSAIGVQVGGYYQQGMAVEGGMFGEIDILFNFRSGELSVFQVTGPQGYIGTPNLFRINGYAGLTKVYGLSRNINFQGNAIYGGITGSGDAFGKLGISVEKGIALQPGIEFPPSVYTDPSSNKAVLYDQTNLNIGANAAGNAFDLGVFGGIAGTKMIFNYAFPYWPIRR